MAESGLAWLTLEMSEIIEKVPNQNYLVSGTAMFFISQAFPCLENGSPGAIFGAKVLLSKWIQYLRNMAIFLKILDPFT